MSATQIKLKANGIAFQATLEDNSSAEAFAALLSSGPLTVSMHDYAGMEKVGRLPQDLPRNDRQISVGPGDIVLYQGNQITVYYGTNSWSLTKLGTVDGATAADLLSALGEDDATVTFSLA